MILATTAMAITICTALLAEISAVHRCQLFLYIDDLV